MTISGHELITVARKRKCRVCGIRRPKTGWAEDDQHDYGRLRFLTPSTICNGCAEKEPVTEIVPEASEPPETDPGAKGTPGPAEPNPNPKPPEPVA